MAKDYPNLKNIFDQKKDRDRPGNIWEVDFDDWLSFSQKTAHALERLTERGWRDLVIVGCLETRVGYDWHKCRFGYFID